VLKLLKFLVEILFELKDDLADHLNLETLAFIGVKLEGIVQEIVNI
jgi:hypothetical protein